MSDAITARANRENMMSHALQVKHFGVQMKMLLAVRAAGSAADASASGAEDSQLKTCVQGTTLRSRTGSDAQASWTR